MLIISGMKRLYNKGGQVGNQKALQKAMDFFLSFSLSSSFLISR